MKIGKKSLFLTALFAFLAVISIGCGVVLVQSANSSSVTLPHQATYSPPQNIAVTLDGNGGTFSDGSSVQTVMQYGDISQFETPSRTGYTFSGWVDSSDNAVASPTDLPFTENITLTAQWEVELTGNTYFTYSDNGDGTVTITGLSTDGQNAGLTAIGLPSKDSSDHSVTSIGNYAFLGCEGLTSVTIPDGVTYIGSSAFRGCTSLTSINIPSSVTSIGVSAFYGCTGLTSVTIPDSVTEIGDTTFYNCTALTSVTIGSGVTSIGYLAFYNCTGLTSINIPDSVTSIGSQAFSGCTGLTSITIPDSVTSIGSSAFQGCTSLAEVKFEHSDISTLTTLGSGAFDNIALNTVYYFKDSEENVIIWGKFTTDYFANTTYHQYNTGEAICLPPQGISVTLIANGGIFSNNSLSVQTVMQYGGISQFETPSRTGYTFSGWLDSSSNAVTSSTYIPFAESITLTAQWELSTYEINLSANNATYGSVNNSTLTIGYGSNISISGNTITFSATDKNDTITVIASPATTTAQYSYAFSNWSVANNTTVTSAMNITAIFNNSLRTYTVNISSSDSTLGTVSASTLTIGYGSSISTGSSSLTFGSTSASSSITVTATPADGYMFSGWKYSTNGSSYTTYSSSPSSVTGVIYFQAQWDGDPTYFTYSNNNNGTVAITGLSTDGQAVLTKVILPSRDSSGRSVTSIGYRAFNSCTGLTSISIPSSVTSIGESAFNGCAGLTSITIPDSVTSIGNYVFYNCTGLTSVTIPSSVTSIGDIVFRGCTGLTSITIPSSVTSIGYGVFTACTGLTSISVDSGNSVYHSAGNCIIHTADKVLIAGCKTSVIPADASVTSIGQSAFSFCTSLTSIIIPDSVTSIGTTAFRNCTGLTSITIPSSVTSIGVAAFIDCTGLTSVTINATSVPTLGRRVFITNSDDIILPNLHIYVVSSLVNNYKSATNWKDYASIISAKP